MRSSAAGLALLAQKSPSYWQVQGEKQALALFQAAAARVPAYKHFLRGLGVRPSSVRTIADFAKLPGVDKKNYISRYTLEELSWDGTLSRGSVIASSSGTSGAAFFWPRGSRQDHATARVHEMLLTHFFQTKKYRTLYLVCFHLGSHVAGMVTAEAIRDTIYTQGQGALMTPGLHREDILRCMKEVGPFFDQVVLLGYPPFLKDVLMLGQEQGVDWRGARTRLVFAAESFPESWRDYVYEIAGIGSRAFGGFNIYGSADFGFMAHETPFTVALRRQADRHRSMPFFDRTFGATPAIFQYHPTERYFEVVNGELWCTADTGMPLIRYNIKDRGAVYQFSDMTLPPVSRAVRAQAWQLPVVLVAGRSNHGVTLYGLNIYPEQIREIVASGPFLALSTGKFFMKSVFNNDQDQQVEIHIELAKGVKETASLRQEMASVCATRLRQINAEYAKLSASIDERADFVVRLYPAGDTAFVSEKMKQNYTRS